MFLPVLLAATFLAALAMAQSLAHALEMPGKMRLEREQYYLVQTIYYPGFTIGGAAEPLAVMAAAVLLALQPAGTERFWLTAAGLVALILTHLLFWVVVQPVNRQWLETTKLSGAAEQFFRTGESSGATSDWTQLRDRWERGHLARAVTSTAGFLLLLMAVALR